MYSPEQKRREVVLHLSALRRRLANRAMTKRSYPHMLKRIAIVEDMIRDYEALIEAEDLAVSQMEMKWEG
jgi:hypothetical protein